MKAFVYEKYGGPEVLQLKEVEQPIPKDNELLIKVHATTVNRTDCANLTGKPLIMHFVIGFLKPKKQIGGTEFSGIVVAVGKDVQNFKDGDKVFGFDDQVLSSHAAYLCINEEKAVDKMPHNITFHQAAASLEGAHYAYNTLTKVNLIKGQKILLNGGSGGIGSALLQLLKQYKVEVTAVTETKNLDLVKSLGAQRVIDFKTTDFTKQDIKYDFIFDTVGKSSFNKCKPILNSKGIYISSELGWMGANIFHALTTPIFSSKKVIFPIPGPIQTSLSYIKKQLATDNYRPVIDKVYPFQELPQAYDYVAQGKKTGNVVIDMT